MIAITLAMVVVNMMVIPAFAKLFKSFSAELPIFTRILIACSDFMLNYWAFLLFGVVSVVMGFKYFLKQPGGRYIFHKGQLRIPEMGPIIEKILLSRFARTMVMVLKTGIPVNSGVKMVANAIGNEYFKDKILKIKLIM